MKLLPRWAALCCLSLCYVLVGCGEGGQYKTAQELKTTRPAGGPKKDAHDHDHGHDHGHHHHAPHHGSLSMLGDHVAQVELVLDPEAGKLDAYILDGEAEKPLAVNQADLELSVTLPEVKDPVVLKLTPVDAAKPEEGFSATNEQLKGVKSFTATLLSLKIGEKTHDKIAVGFDAAQAAKEAEESHKEGHDDHAHGDQKVDDHADHDHGDKKGDEHKDHDHEGEHKDEHKDDKPAEDKK